MKKMIKILNDFTKKSNEVTEDIISGLTATAKKMKEE